MPDELERFGLELGEGSAGAVRIEWDAEALAAYSSMSPDDPGAPPWRLDESHPDWKRWKSLSILSAAFEDGAMLACAALEPHKQKGHDGDVVGALLVRDDTPLRFEELLLSRQFDGRGGLTRVNAEAFLDPDSVPIRATGDLVGTSAREDGERSIEVSVLEMSMGGRRGVGTVDVLRPA